MIAEHITRLASRAHIAIICAGTLFMKKTENTITVIQMNRQLETDDRADIAGKKTPTLATMPASELYLV